MSILQYAFLIALSGSLLAVALVAAATVRTVAVRRGGVLTDSWLERLAMTTRADDHVWAFIVHRVTGIAIFAFLAVHILDVSVYAVSPDAFDEIHDLYGTTPMRLFECLLLYGILFHTFNGLRLLLLDVRHLGVASARWSLRVASVAAIALGTAGSVLILEPVWT